MTRKLNFHRILTALHAGMTDLARLFAPDVCEVCGQPLVAGEKILCMECTMKIPLTNSHLTPDNNIEKRLVDVRYPLERAVSFFRYHKENPYTRLILNAKYYNRPAINLELGRLYALELEPTGFFSNIDAIIPLPIHWTKYFRRGYCQTDYIARGICKVVPLPILHNLRACKPHKSQTKKSGRERGQALSDIFVVTHPEELTDMHILLVDDVITTGSTLLACIRTLKESCPSLKISVLTLAATHQN